LGKIFYDWRISIGIQDFEFTFSAACTFAIASPVEGLKTGKVFPETELCHSLLINTCKTIEFKNMDVHYSIIKRTFFVLNILQYIKFLDLSEVRAVLMKVVLTCTF
jgi:hypothetical protein